jgi:hypothetical protein
VHVQYFINFWNVFREEIDRINKDNDNLELELRTETEKVAQEVKNRKKLERVLQDAAGALRVALRVGNLCSIGCSRCSQGGTQGR